MSANGCQKSKTVMHIDAKNKVRTVSAVLHLITHSIRALNVCVYQVLTFYKVSWCLYSLPSTLCIERQLMQIDAKNKKQ